MFSAVTRLLSLFHLFWGGGRRGGGFRGFLLSCFCHNLGGKVTGCGTQCDLHTEWRHFLVWLDCRVKIALISNLDPAAVQYLIVFLSTLVCSILVFLCLLPLQYKYQGEIFISLLYVSLLLGGIKAHKFCFISCQQNCIRHHTWNWEVYESNERLLSQLPWFQLNLATI